MGAKRIIDTSFWTDTKMDEFSPEDKYFWLYLLTNPFSKQLGIYELSARQAAFQMGYSIDSFNVLLDRFENKYNMIRYSKETSEVAILNFLRHSVVKGGKPVEDCIRKDMTLVKDKRLIDFVFARLHGREGLNDTVAKIIAEHIKENEIDNDNDNDNDNDRTGDDTPTYRPKEEPKKPSKAEIDEFFFAIWNLYPVKKGKGQVSDAKRKALYAIGAEEMQRAIDRYLQELKKDADWRKPQNGSTFFNSGYVDYLDANFSPDEAAPIKKTTYKKQTKADELNDAYHMMAAWAEGES